MNAREHLLTILSEECSEVAQEISKALRFGIKEVMPGQDFTNAERIENELIDLLATLNMCVDVKLLNLKIKVVSPYPSVEERFVAKKLKVVEYMNLAKNKFKTIQ